MTSANASRLKAVSLGSMSAASSIASRSLAPRVVDKRALEASFRVVVRSGSDTGLIVPREPFNESQASHKST